MDVSVIIVNYNTRILLADCLDSIQQQTFGLDYEVIVVDNNSKDGSQDFIKNKYSWVRLIESSENLGFGKANNLGMELASGKYFFLLNSDTILKNNALKYFFDYSESHTNFGALGSILLGPNQKNCHSYGKFPTQKRLIKVVIAKYLRFLKDKTCLHPASIETPISVEYITGADLWVPRTVYKSIGGFDGDYFMYFEEVDWQYRMYENNLDRIIIPGPQIIHLEGGSESKVKLGWSKNRKENYDRSQRIYQDKHFNNKTYPFFRVLFTVLNLPSDIILKILNRNK